MSNSEIESLPEEQELALAYTPVALRQRLAAALALDRRLAQIVSKTTEPMLGQMRLAWWRDILNAPKSDRPSGDAVLDALSVQWEGREEALVQLVNGWEMLVAEEEMTRDVIESFGSSRGAPFAALDDFGDEAVIEQARSAGACWALADAASHISDADERTRFVEIALARHGKADPLPKSLRGLAVLQALAKHALDAGGQPLMQGRASALRALKVGLLGR